VQVEILETADNGFAKVRCVGDGETEGWVRARNISRIERKTGLLAIEQITQMAIDEVRPPQPSHRTLHIGPAHSITRIEPTARRVNADAVCGLAWLTCEGLRVCCVGVAGSWASEKRRSMSSSTS
jgi:hypothetical protein